MTTGWGKQPRRGLKGEGPGPAGREPGPIAAKGQLLLVAALFTAAVAALFGRLGLSTGLFARCGVAQRSLRRLSHGSSLSVWSAAYPKAATSTYSKKATTPTMTNSATRAAPS